ncbi:Tripartite motif-containing protein 29 [Oryzias melastigma]|uniref:Tripartite motif-containing protein 29 n=1 Tax=Oryzias melastigma TaxID=30732 RepID=A0A834FBN0_ORYME|nr:Tripartite motif-containing protein 29 [Oryzias melastigma]
MSDKMEVVFCEMCPEEDRKPAKKMCLKCEISMCVQHLQAHLTTPVLLQTHPLTEPTALGAATKCPQHGKLLEYFCLDDMACVCVSCAIEDQHRLHNMKTFSTAHKELMEKLVVEHKALQSKTEEDNMSLEKWEKGKREALSMSAVRLVEAVNNLRDLSLTSVQSSVSARMVSIRTSKSSIQSAQAEKDTFRFLQMYSQVHQDVEKAKAVDLRKGLEPGEHRDKLVKEIIESGEKMMTDATYFLRSLLTLVDPENHQTCGIASPDLFFEPLTHKSSISVSKDKRTVFYNSGMGDCTTTLLIKSSKSTSNLRTWIVDLTEDADWMVGFCDKKSPQNFMNGPVFGLRCDDSCLSKVTTRFECSNAASGSGAFGINPIAVSETEKKAKVSSQLIKYEGEDEDKKTRPETLEVIWNLANSTLSFYSRTGQFQRKEIITIRMERILWDLTPFVHIGKLTQPQSYSVHRQSNGPFVTEKVCELIDGILL